MSIIGISGKAGSGKNAIGLIIQYLVYREKFSTSHYLYYPEDVFLSEYKEDPNLNLFESGWEIKGFAGKLKDIICLLIGCTREQLEDRTFKETDLGKEWDCYSYEDWSNLLYPNNNYPNFLSAEKVENLLGGSYRTLSPRKLLQIMGTDCGRKLVHPNLWVNSLFSDYIPKKYSYSPSELPDLVYPNWLITDVRFPNEANGIKGKDGLLIRVNRSLSKDTIDSTHESETALDNYEGFDYTIENVGTLGDLIDNVRFILVKENILND